MTPDALHDRLSTLADPACKAFGDSLQTRVTDRLGVGRARRHLALSSPPGPPANAGRAAEPCTTDGKRFGPRRGKADCDCRNG